MRANRSRDTNPELEIRRRLHGAGLRYRVDLAVRLDGRRPVRPDVVFTRKRLCVFIDGCFWHGCSTHCRLPTANQEYWQAKIDRNRQRDTDTSAALRDAGWMVLRAWEHESPEAVVERIRETLRAS
jgi:DNA mismatch endonuclease (patch repair protein)